MVVYDTEVFVFHHVHTVVRVVRHHLYFLLPVHVKDLRFHDTQDRK